MTGFDYAQWLGKATESDDYKSFIETEFSSFFDRCAKFLSQQPENIRGRMLSTRRGIVVAFLDKMERIMSKSEERHYFPEMVDQINRFFAVVMYPGNSPKFWVYGIPLYVILVEKIRPHLSNFQWDVEQLFTAETFNRNSDQRIFVDAAQAKDPTYLYINVKRFLEIIEKKPREDSLFWWKIAERLFLAKFYGPNKVGMKCDMTEVHGLIVQFAMKVVGEEGTFMQILNDSTSSVILFGVLHFSGKCAKVSKHDEFVKAFIMRMIGDLAIVVLLTERNISLNYVAIEAIVNVLRMECERLRGVRKTTDKMDGVSIISELFCGFFDALHKAYTPENHVKLCRRLLSDITDPDFRTHVRTLLVICCVNGRVSDKRLWDSVIDRNDGQRLVIVNICVHIACYMSVCAARRLLGFESNFEEVVMQSKERRHWVCSNGQWNHPSQWSRGSLPFFIAHKDQLTAPESVEQSNSRSIPLHLLKIDGWSPDDALEAMRVMRETFNWRVVTEDVDLQFKFFLVGASLIIPIVKLMKMIPDCVDFDCSFLMTDVLDWLKECVSPSVKNMYIVVRALGLLDDIVCMRNAAPLLSAHVLCDWYETLRYHIASENTELKETALSFACHSIMMGLRNSHMLISSIATNFVMLCDMDHGDGFQLHEPADSFLSMNVICDFASEVCFGQNESETVSSTKKHIVELIGRTERLKIVAWVSVLIEEVIAGRDLLVSFVLDMMFAVVKVEMTADIVYALWPIIFVLPEMEKTQSGSVSRLLATLLDIMDADDVIQEDAFLILVDLVTDVLVYSAYLVDCAEFMRRFETISRSWKLDSDECKLDERSARLLSYAIMYLANNFMRFPFPKLVGRAGTSSQGAIFGTSKDHIMKVNGHEIISVLPIGRFTWRFRSIAPVAVLPPRNSSEDTVGIVPSVCEEEQQRAFSTPLTSFFGSLENTVMCDPKDFASPAVPKLNESSSVQPGTSLKAPSHLPGSPAVAFASSIGFIGPPADNRIVPVLHDFIPAVESGLFSSDICFRHCINVGCISTGSPPHFEDFLSGLGFWHESIQAHVYADCRHEIVFRQSDFSGKILIIWRDGLTCETLLGSYSEQNIIRIEITPRDTGLFTVSIRVIADQSPGFPSLSEVVVSKRSLPSFVLAQVLTNSLVYDRRVGKQAHVFMARGAELQTLRGANFSLSANDLICSKSLFSTD